MISNLYIWKITRKKFLLFNLGYMKYKSQFSGLSNKTKNARNNVFIFNEIVKLTIKIDSRLSNTNVR